MQEPSELSQKIKASESEFLSYWQEIDIIKQFEAEELEGALDQPVRKAIINILSEGREIIDKEGNSRVLRVMNASQLLERINKIAEEPNKYNVEPIKRSNLYYHINALVERGFISEVGLIPKKNRLISYYGRTARVFLLNYDYDKKPPILKDDVLPSLMRSINEDLSDEEINGIIDKLNLMYDEVDTEPIYSWVEENEKALRNSEIDIRTLHNIFYKILAFDDETIAAMRKFAEAMKLDLS